MGSSNRIQGLVLRPNKGNWTGSNAQGLPAQYILALLNLEGKNTFLQDNILQEEYIFAMNPQAIQLEDPFATSIIPTQGGIYKDSKGIVLSNLTISGTTGLRPNKGKYTQTFGNPVTMSANTVLDPTTGLPPGEVTGFDEYIKLRNFILQFSQIQKNPDIASQYIMVFQNGKDEETLVVEPTSLTFPRDKGSPFTHAYNLAFRVLGRYAGLVKRNQGFNFQQVTNLVTKYRRQLTYYYTLTNSLLNKNHIPGFAVINDALQPVSSILNLLNSQSLAGLRMLDPPGGSHLEDTIRGIRNSTTSLDLFQSQYSDIFDHVTVSTSGIEVEDAYLSRGQATSRQLLSNSLKNMVIVLSGVKQYMDSTREDLNINANSAKKNYIEKARDLSKSGGNDGIKVPNANNFKEIVVQGNESIQDFAKRTTGDISLWKYIVALNQLKVPYISAGGDGSSVVRPGDSLMVPNNLPNDSSQVSVDPVASASELDKKLGRDLRLQIASTSNNSYTSYDLLVGPNGDISLISGVPNMEQAVNIKFNTEQSELKLHPEFGGLFPIGTKGQSSSILKFKNNTKTMLIEDSRISDILEFTVRQEADILNVKIILEIAGSSETIETTFNLGQ